MSKNNSFNCISCPIAHTFLSEYISILRTKEAKKNSSEEIKNSKNKVRSSIEKLSNLFSISFDEMRNLLSDNRYQEELEIAITSNNFIKIFCLNRITSIIPMVDKLLSHSQKPASDLSSLNKESIKLLIEIENFLNENDIEMYNEPLTSEEKDWSDTFLKSIGLIKNSTTNRYYSKEDLTEENEENAETAFYKFYDLIDRYADCNINNSQHILRYKHCDESYKNNALLKNVSIKQFNNCQEDLLVKKEISKQEIVRNKINNILNYETTILSKIMCNYLKRAKKKPKYIIDSLMNLQRITDTDIAILLFENSEEKTNVRKWHKRNNSTEELPKQAKLHLKELAKIFLVSEDVLSCGTGKIYGNWKIALDENKNSNSNFQNQLLTSEDIKELKKIEIPQHRRPASKTRKQIYVRIRNFINQTDDNFKIMISENPEFFYEEDICLFTYEEDGEEYYDYDLMYENLLHPEDFDTLLSVLEELQSKENN